MDNFSALPYLLGVSKSIHHFRIDHNAPFLLPVPKFQFFLGISVVQREIEDNGYVNIWRVNKVHYGLCENHEFPVVFCKVTLTKKEAGIETGGSKMSAMSAFFYGELNLYLEAMSLVSYQLMCLFSCRKSA